MDITDPRIKHITYKCTGCGKKKDRDGLTVKRAVFTTMGQNFRTLRSRSVAWLCDACRDKDADYNRERGAAAPGMANTKMNDGH